MKKPKIETFYGESNVNEFIASPEVGSVIDVKVTTVITNLGINIHPNFPEHSEQTNYRVIYTVIYIPSDNE